jgi:hypothetical protein
LCLANAVTALCTIQPEQYNIMTFRSYPFLALSLALGNAADRLGFVILKKGDAELCCKPATA